ncbi:MAG: YfhO family protein, partial [Delftia sp.]|nr:YfhO family protein [Delftia sp.]
HRHKHALKGSPDPAVKSRIPPFLERLTRLALAGAIAFCLAAPMLLPAMERMPWTTRSLEPQDQRHGYEFFPALLADNLAPHIHGRGADGWWSSMDRVESGYVGAITLFLGVLGLLTRRRRAAFWVLLGALAFVFALGYQAPLYPAVAGWPFFTYLWKTARVIFLSSFALAVLGALGLQALLEGKDERWARGWRILLLVGALGLGVAAPRLLQSVPSGQPYGRALDNLRLAALLAASLAALAWGWRRWRWMPAGIILLLVGELVALGALAETDPSAPLSGPKHAEALAFLRADTGWFRVDSQGAARHLWSPEVLQAQGFETLQGSGNPLSLWPFEQFYWAQPTKDAPGYRLLGAKYIVVPKDALPGGEGIWPVFGDDPLVDIHLNTLALPRAWLVYRTQPV